MNKEKNCLAKYPVAKRTKSVCVCAVDEDPLAIKYVPEKCLSATMVEKASRRDPEIIKFVPDKYKNDHTCENAIRYDAMLLKYVPQEKRKEDLMCIAVAKDPEAIRFIPRSDRTENVYASLVKAHPELLGTVPVKQRTEKVCLGAVRRMDEVADLVPPKAKTVNLCSKVMMAFPDLDFTPAKIRQKAYLWTLGDFCDQLYTVITNHDEIRHCYGYNGNAASRRWMERKLSAYVNYKYHGVQIKIEQYPTFSCRHTYYHLYAYYNGYRKTIREVKKTLDDVLAEMDEIRASLDAKEKAKESKRTTDKKSDANATETTETVLNEKNNAEETKEV